MSIQSKKDAKFDGYIAVAGGVHSGISPLLLQEGQAVYAENVAFRGAFPTTRPGIRKLTRVPPTLIRPSITPGSRASVVDGTPDTLFDTGTIQGMGFYRPNLGLPILVAVVGGRFYRMEPNSPGGTTFTISPLSRDKDLLEGEANWPGTIGTDFWDFNPKPMQAYFQQVEESLVVQNNHDVVRIYDNTTIRRAVSGEMPTGGPMAFGQGRLFVANGKRIYAGDISGGPTSALEFTETDYFAGGGYFVVPDNVEGMRFITVGDTGTGQGELVIASRGSSHTLDVAKPRSTWQDIDIQKALTLNSGAVSHKGMTSVNEDIWLRAEDGERSIKLAISEQKIWSRTPSSTEIRRILDFDDAKWVSYTASTLFDNRLIWTVGHRGTKEGTGFAVLDFDPISALGQQPRPAYDGLWHLNGVEPIDIVTGDFGSGERCIFIGKETATGETHLWEITRSGSDDDGTDIPALMESRAFGFGDPFAHNQIDRADVFISDMKGNVSFDLDVRPDCEETWFGWDTKSRLHDNTVDDADVAAASTVPPEMPKSGCSRLTFGTIPEGDRDETVYPDLGVKDRGTTFQVRMRWSGHLKVARLWLHARDIIEQPTADVD